MKLAAGISLLGLLLLGGCRTAHDVAVTSFRVIDAPANYVRHHLDESATTTTASSDVVTPGRSIDPSAAPSPAARRRPATTTVETDSSSNAPTTPRSRTQTTSAETTQRNSTAPATTRATTTQGQQYPTAKPVPGKPGFVYSPYDPNGGYVDVTGYASGSKAKDPYSQKIFVVP
jgi:uncharacterized membrane protein